MEVKRETADVKHETVSKGTHPSHVCRLTSVLLLLLCLSILLISCDQSFQPIKESDSVPLSIYGYLDASADTQWVRVTPIRYQIEQTFEKPEMQVELQHLQSGNSYIMSDSLFRFRQGFNAINVWSTFDIEPGETYQLEASRPDGAISRATVEIPEEFPQPTIADVVPGCVGLLRIEGVPLLVDVQSKWDLTVYFLDEEKEIVLTENRTAVISYRSSARRIAAGAYEVYIDSSVELNKILSGLQDVSYGLVVHKRVLYIAKGGPEWTEEIRDLDEIEYALPEGVSNIENGLGYMFGIVSRSVPYQPTDDCVNPFDPSEH